MQSIKDNAKVNSDTKEVVLDLSEWYKLIAYVDDLKKANEALNNEIERYNKLFGTEKKEK